MNKSVKAILLALTLGFSLNSVNAFNLGSCKSFIKNNPKMTALIAGGVVLAAVTVSFILRHSNGIKKERWFRHNEFICKKRAIARIDRRTIDGLSRYIVALRELIRFTGELLNDATTKKIPLAIDYYRVELDRLNRSLEVNQASLHTMQRGL